MPLSRTLTIGCSPATRASTATRPPSGVNLHALPIRLLNTCDSRARSACSLTGRSGRCDLERHGRRARPPAGSPRPRARSPRAGRRPRRRSVSLSRLMPADVEQVVDQAHEVARAGAPSRCSPCSKVAGSPALRCTIASELRSGASGLRSSCASVARNSSFLRSASSQRLDRPLLLGDVADDAEHPLAAVGAADDAAARRDPAHLAVAGGRSGTRCRSTPLTHASAIARARRARSSG